MNLGTSAIKEKPNSLFQGEVLVEVKELRVTIRRYVSYVMLAFAVLKVYFNHLSYIKTSMNYM